MQLNKCHCVLSIFVCSSTEGWQPNAHGLKNQEPKTDTGTNTPAFVSFKVVPNMSSEFLTAHRRRAEIPPPWTKIITAMCDFNYLVWQAEWLSCDDAFKSCRQGGFFLFSFFALCFAPKRLPFKCILIDWNLERISFGRNFCVGSTPFSSWNRSPWLDQKEIAGISLAPHHHHHLKGEIQSWN